MQPPARGRSPKPGRGRGPARWTPWEIALIIVSVAMIAFPLYAGTTRLIFPPVAPAQESTPPAAEASPTNDPVFPETETPAPTDTPPPPPSETPPAPSNTPGTAASNTPGTVASNTPVSPTSTSDSTVEQGPTRTSTSTPLVTNTPTPVTPTITNTPPPGASPTFTSTPPPGTSPTLTNTPPPGASPTSTSTIPPATGVRVFKVPSVTMAAVGQQFSYSISVVTSSITDSRVTLDDTISNNLDLISATSGSGDCTTSGQSISCRLTIRDINPATVTVQVRVRAGVPVDTIITNEATADGVTSASVSVRVIGAPPPPITVTGTPPTNTPTSTATNPSIPPVTPPTNTPGGGGGDGDGDDNGGDDNGDGGGTSQDRPRNTQVPIAPPAPPTPDPNALPTEPPTPDFGGGVTSVRPTAAVRPTRVPPAPTNTPSDLIPITGTTASPTAIVGVGGTGEIFFRLASDWGSAYPGQTVNYTLALRNTRPPAAGGANDLRNVVVRSVLPDNLDIQGTDADRGPDPTLNGNEVTYSLPLLQPGEGVEILIASRIKPNVTPGTILVTQGQLTYDGLAQGLFSNIVTVQVVGNAQQTAAPLLTPTAGIAATSGTAYPPPATGTTVAATATARTTGPTATATRTSTQPTIAPSMTPFPYTPQPPAPLPETAAGVPFMGILLLGMTLMTRTWRLHRAKERL